MINDTTKFKKLKDNPTLTREGQLQRFLRKIKDKNLFDQSTYYLWVSEPATIYCLSKIHKMLFDSSFQSIISSTGTIIKILLNFSLNFFIQLAQKSITPISYKIGLIRCPINRPFKVSNSYIMFQIRKYYITNRKLKFSYRNTCILKVLLKIKLKYKQF